MDVTVITPSIPSRARMLLECRESVSNQIHKVHDHLYDVDHGYEGPARVRNRLVKEATTEWIAFLDDDDLLYPNHFELHAPFADDYDVIYSWGDIVHNGGGRETFTSGYDEDIILGGRNMIPITASVRRSCFNAVGGFSETERFEDWFLWKTFIQHGVRFAPPIEIVTWEYRTGHGNRNDSE